MNGYRAACIDFPLKHSLGKAVRSWPAATCGDQLHSTERDLTETLHSAGVWPGPRLCSGHDACADHAASQLPYPQGWPVACRGANPSPQVLVNSLLSQARHSLIRINLYRENSQDHLHNQRPSVIAAAAKAFPEDM